MRWFSFAQYLEHIFASRAICLWLRSSSNLVGCEVDTGQWRGFDDFAIYLCLLVGLFAEAFCYLPRRFAICLWHRSSSCEVDNGVVLIILQHIFMLVGLFAEAFCYLLKLFAIC